MMVGAMVADFAKEIQGILTAEKFYLRAEDGTQRLPQVYAHALPCVSKHKPPIVPWVLVALYDGAQASADDLRKATLHITCMVYDDREDMQGYRDAMQLIERICWNLYGQSFVAGKYEVVYPFQFAAIDDVRYPYFSAGLAVKVELAGTVPEKINGGYAYV